VARHTISSPVEGSNMHAASSTAWEKKEATGNENEEEE
jgi:hypothetical protein